MELRTLGRVGLKVSALGLGTLTWGRDTDEDEARLMLEGFADAGGTLIDTAGNYGDGEAEAVIGRLLAGAFSRADFVICSKAGVRADADQGWAVDASRATLLDSLETSLRRLGTDHLDVWLVQHYDPATRAGETLAALELALRSGMTRYVGVSNFPSWAFAELATMLRQSGWEAAMNQVEYSLLNRAAEGHTLAAAAHFGAGVVAWSPLARGVLSGKYRSHTPPDSRAAADHLRGFVAPYLDERYAGTVEATCEAAAGLDLSPAQAALLWARDAPGITSALLGARTATQLTQLLAVAERTLPHQIRVALNDVS